MPAPNLVTPGARIPEASRSLVVAEMKSGKLTDATARSSAPNASATKILGKRSNTKGAFAQSGVIRLLDRFLAQIRRTPARRFPDPTAGRKDAEAGTIASPS